MANIFLSDNEQFTVFGGNDNKVFGKSGNGTERVTLAGGATGVQTDANIEAVTLDGDSGDFTYQQEGNSLSVFSGNTKVASIPLQIGSADTDGDGTLLTFDNGTFSAKFDTTNASVTLGGTTVPNDNPGAVTPGNDSPSVSVTTDVQSADEGDTVVATFESDPNTDIDYAITGVNADDIDGNTALTGTITTDANGEATLSIDLAEDETTEGEEVLKITGTSGSNSDDASVTVNDTSKAAPTTLAVDTNSIDEGDTVVATVTGAKAGATLSYTITGVSAADIDKPLTGTITANGQGTATLSIAAAKDESTEGVETLKLTIDGNSEDITINDTSKDAKTFTLTNGTDSGADFLGSDGVDVYEADLLTVNSGDSLDGAGGIDRLNATINTDVQDDFVAKNIEEITFTSLGANSVDMTSIAEATRVTNTSSTGDLTLTNISNANVIMAFKGDGDNDTIALYDTGGAFGGGALSGSSDTIQMEMDGANSVSLDVAAGFESASIKNTGESDIEALNLTGVTEFILSGDGELDMADNVITGFSLISGRNFSGVLTTGSADSDGFASGALTGGASGATFLLGEGASNIGFTQAAGADQSDTLRLGGGADVVNITALTAGDLFLFTEAGDDKARIESGLLTASDVINMGAGNDNLVLMGAGTNTLIARGVESIVQGNGADLDVNSADSALKITAYADASTVSSINLSGGSTVKVVEEPDGGGGAVTGLTVSFDDEETATTIDVDVDVDANANGVSVDNVLGLTLDLAEGATDTGTLEINEATSLTIKAGDDLTVGAIQTDGAQAAEELASLTITGEGAVTVGSLDANSEDLSNVKVNAEDDIDLNNGNSFIDDAGSLKSLVVDSADGSVQIGNVALLSEGADITAESATTLELGTLDGSSVGDVKATAGNGLLEFGAIGGGTDGKIDSLTFESTKGAIQGAAITADDADGLDVSLTAKTDIDDDGNGAAFTITNNTGDVDVSLAGDAEATFDVTSGDGVANLSATNTGGLTTTLTNAATEGDGDTATITLGNAKATKTNTVTVAGTVDVLNITGGSGKDELAFNANIDIQSGTFDLKGGRDSINFTNIEDTLSEPADNGIIVNLSSSSVTFDSGTNNQSAIGAGKAAEYDTDKDVTGEVVVTAELNLTLSNVDDLTGTENIDYLIAANTGSEIDGGAGNDILVGKEAKDTLKGGDGEDSITGGGGNDELSGGGDSDTFNFVDDNGADSITDFTTNEDKLSFDGISGITATAGTAVAADAAAQNVSDGAVYVFADGNDGTAAEDIDTYSGDGFAADVAAFLAAAFDDEAAGDQFVAVINDVAGDKTYAYLIDFDAGNDGAGALDADAVSLLATIDEVADAPLVFGDIS